MAMRQVVWSRDVKKAEAEAEAASSRLMWIDVLLNKCTAAGVDTNTDTSHTQFPSMQAKFRFSFLSSQTWSSPLGLGVR